MRMHSVSTAQCERVCFSGGHFANPVKRIGPIEDTMQLCGHILKVLPLLARCFLALWCGLGPFWLPLVAFPTLNS